LRQENLKVSKDIGKYFRKTNEILVIYYNSYFDSLTLSIEPRYEGENLTDNSITLGYSEMKELYNLIGKALNYPEMKGE